MGFGRIGRNILRQAADRDDIDIVAISDLASPSAMAYLLQYDTVYGRFAGEVGLEGQVLYAGRQRCRLLRGVTPLDLPWDAFGVDIVVEATHQYRTRELLEGHLVSGAKRVILTTPALDDIDRTIVHGVNHQNLESSDHIVSCSSTTTHAMALTLKSSTRRSAYNAPS
jgi:glyceraldehyde-3-phosphate dehydrogenase type I